MEFIDLKPAVGNFKQDVIDGLSREPRSVPPMYMFDEAGSLLFNQVCQLEEYHVPHVEARILTQTYPELRALAGPAANIVEFGSGAGMKIRRLLDALDGPASVTSIDISKELLLTASAALRRDYPDMSIRAICSDFTALKMPLWNPDSNAGLTLGLFLGTTISNMEPLAATELLSNMRSILGPNGALLIGVDMLRDPDIVLPGFKDKHGVNDAFNLNLLTRIKNELDAQVDIESFEHVALFNKEKARVEEYLESQKHQKIVIGDEEFVFDKGDSILVGISYRFTIESFASMAHDAGFTPLKHWTDPNRWYAVHWLKVS